MTTYTLWTDLEGTGKETDLDEIIEVAFILTRVDDLVEIAHYHALVVPSQAGFLRIVQTPEVLRMHTENGLLLELIEQAPDDRRSIDGVDMEVGAWLMNSGVRVTDGDVLHLAGSGVAAYDRPLINNWMPVTAGLLHYAPIDVGVLRRTWKMWTGGDITGDNAAKDHRAASDVAGHLREAQAFRERFKVVHEALAAKD